jgi:hypothetical protein
MERLHATSYMAIATAAAPAEAKHLYEWARTLPLSQTRGRFHDATGYTLNGPASYGEGLLLAFNSAGATFVFKIASSAEDPEVVAALALHGLPGVVPCTFHTASRDDGSVFCGLLMPKYERSLADVTELILDESELLSCATRLVAAVRAVHSTGYVHMDIKEANIFVGVDGSWWLGDFGSCVAVGTAVVSTTPGLHPGLSEFFEGKHVAAQYSHDLYMTMALIVRQLDSRSTHGLRSDPAPGIVSMRDRIVRIKLVQLQDFMLSLLGELEV